MVVLAIILRFHETFLTERIDRHDVMLPTRCPDGTSFPGFSIPNSSGHCANRPDLVRAFRLSAKSLRIIFNPEIWVRDSWEGQGWVPTTDD